MKFVCLVYADDAVMPAADMPARAGIACLARQSLYGTDTATTLRVRNGRLSLADGPVVDTVPPLTRVFVIDAVDEAAALAWAAALPDAANGSVEVRPVRDLLAE
ncbi:MAG: YciI family protein [Burkholderiales bacterium]